MDKERASTVFCRLQFYSSNKLKKDHTIYEGIFNHIYDFTIDL